MFKACKVDLFEDNFNDELFDKVPDEKPQRKRHGLVCSESILDDTSNPIKITKIIHKNRI